MESSIIVVFRNITLVLIAMLFITNNSALATDDTLAFGDYKGKCSSTTLSFKMDENGITSININGTLFGNALLGDYGRMGSVKLYEFGVEVASLTKFVTFLILFDENEKPASVTGFYSETVTQKKNSGIDEILKNSCVLMMSHSPLKK